MHFRDVNLSLMK